MRLLQLTVTVRNIRTHTTTERSFSSSPVTMGRSPANVLLLDARSVSREHGVLTYSPNGLEFIDLDSSNGSFVDGDLAHPHAPFLLDRHSVVTIGPFQITARLELVPIPMQPPAARTRPRPLGAHEPRVIVPEQVAPRADSSAGAPPRL
jgi:pSer/pThr/pTyr-binding forkhead associated (FHA) protein